MAKSKTKLELMWIGKENRPRLEPRILIEDPEKSYHATQRHSEDDIFDNRRLLHPTEGLLRVPIDDREVPYLRVLMDEICNRNSFVAANVCSLYGEQCNRK